MKFTAELRGRILEHIRANGFGGLGEASKESLYGTFGISRKTFLLWQRQNPKFARDIEEAARTYREGEETALVRSLFGIATGRIKYREEKREFDSKGKLLRITITEKQLPPNNNAINFLLCNLFPERYARDGHPKRREEGKIDITKITGMRIIDETGGGAEEKEAV